MNEGSTAPEFSLPASDGTMLSLKSLRGSTVVLYFYPKDDTPGCTAEACDFGAMQSKFLKQRARVLGISPDSVRKHGNFIRKYKLPFTLLSDAKHQVCEAYGCWGEKQMFGRKYMGVIRSTFVIDPKGKIKSLWRKVSVEGHASEVLISLG